MSIPHNSTGAWHSFTSRADLRQGASAEAEAACPPAHADAPAAPFALDAEQWKLIVRAVSQPSPNQRYFHCSGCGVRLREPHDGSEVFDADNHSPLPGCCYHCYQRCGQPASLSCVSLAPWLVGRDGRLPVGGFDSEAALVREQIARVSPLSAAGASSWGDTLFPVGLIPDTLPSLEAAPPISNTAAQRQGLATGSEPNRTKVAVLIDWLQGRIPAEVQGEEVDLDTVASIIEDACGLKGDDRPQWVDGQTRTGNPMLVWGVIRIVHGAKGFIVTIPGSGCRQMEAAGLTDWHAFCQALYLWQFDAQRVDIAYDDRDHYLTMPTVLAAMKARSYVSRSNGWRPVESFSGPENTSSGLTIYVGERTSDTFVRIYDKRQERIAKGEPDAGHWVRVEVEYKGDNAPPVFHALCGMRESDGFYAPWDADNHTADKHEELQGDVSRYLAGLLRGHLDFKEAGTHTRLKNCKTADWWRFFLDDCAKTKLHRAPVVRSVDKLVEWVARQVGPALAVIRQASGYGNATLEALVEWGERRLRPAHLDMLKRHNTQFVTGVNSPGKVAV